MNNKELDSEVYELLERSIIAVRENQSFNGYGWETWSDGHHILDTYFNEELEHLNDEEKIKVRAHVGEILTNIIQNADPRSAALLAYRKAKSAAYGIELQFISDRIGL